MIDLRYKEATFMGSKKLQAWLPLLLAVMMVLGMMIGYKLKSDTSGGSFLNSSRKSSLQEVVDLVKAKYVDPLPADSINQAVIDDLLSHLDPHSVYIPPAEVKDVNEEMTGNFQGIGVEFQLFNDTINIVRVITGGPSEKVGLMVGDELLKANDTISLTGNKLKPGDIRKQLRGPAGSTVKITVLRQGKLKNFFIKRGNIPVPSVEVAYMIAPQTGYLMINRFGERTYEEFMQNMEKLQKQGMQKLILDLRGNGGGLLSEATAIADEFLDDEKLIVYTKGDHTPRYEYRCKKDGLFEKGKLVVLVNETSASASEVLTGALQDWDRATIIGRRTFGKGLVQQQFQLSNGGALRLTVARYYTPLGRNIQKPYNKGKEKYEEELLNRFHDGELLKLDSTKLKGPEYKTPAGHIVYGGGGITPDIFVSFDTSLMRASINKLYSKNSINYFVYKYYLTNKNYFVGLKSVQNFEKSFTFGQQQWQQLKSCLVKDSLELPKSEKAKQEVAQKVKALLARQAYGSEAYYQIINSSDATVEKALDVLK